MSEWLHQNVIWLIPAAPLAACLWIVAFGTTFRRNTAHRPVVLALLISFLAAMYLQSAVIPAHFESHGDEHAASGSAILYPIYEWINVGRVDVEITLRADAMSALMLVMVTSVSLLVAIFASGYMHGDPGYPRFFAAISLFVFSMCMLVLASNFLMLFVFWEAVGLCSYLLIGFWYHKASAAAAAKKAFVVNRIGDFGLILGIFLIWTTFGTLDFERILVDPTLLKDLAIIDQEGATLTAICLLLFVGAVGKSAQFPLHVWLPDAMEGPTPVSALIHAATMVTAGVYLVARCTPLFVHAPYAQLWVSGIGAATALIAAITAWTQYDLKRVLAYSTVSQLGFMFMSLGAAAGDEHLAVPAVTFALFHMFTHAYFKAVLFLSAGSVMHAMGDVIDMRRFSGLRKALPITHITFLAGALALAGVPLLSGFWSKDEILSVVQEATKGPYGRFFSVVYGVALFSSLLTAFYTFRAYYMTFHGPERFPEEAGHHPHDAPPAMAGPLYLLAAAALGIGLLTGPTHWYADYLHHTPGWPHAEKHDMNPMMMLISSVIALGGILAAYLIYGSGRSLGEHWKSVFGPLFEVSQQGLFLDAIFQALIVRPMRSLAEASEFIDRMIVDKLVDAVGAVPGLLGRVLRPMQNGLVQNYAAMMLIGLVVGLLIVLAPMLRALAAAG